MISVMAKIEEKIVSQLCSISETLPVDWTAFDALLSSIPDINVIDEDAWEETYLSSCIENIDAYHSGEILVDMIRHFLAQGYDVGANEGKNGGLCLSQLCWSSYDRYIIDAAKVLLSAGAPINYPSKDDEPDEPTGVMGSIDWKISGAWVVDKDYSWANTLETYYQIVKAIEKEQPYENINTYHNCVGKKLEHVEFLGKDNLCRDENGLIKFNDSLVFWFDSLPLVASKYIDFVVNPYTVEDNKGSMTNADDCFSTLIGAYLQNIIHLNQSTCYMQFDNGQRLLFTSIDTGDKERTGFAEIGKSEKVCLTDTSIESICFWNNKTYANSVTKYEEEVLALFKETEAALIFTVTADSDENYIDAISCGLDFAREYVQQLPICKPDTIELFHYSGGLKAIRFKCGDRYLYAQAHEYYGFEVVLSEEKIQITEPTLLRRTSGIHMNFIKRPAETNK